MSDLCSSKAVGGDSGRYTHHCGVTTFVRDRVAISLCVLLAERPRTQMMCVQPVLEKLYL